MLKVNVENFKTSFLVTVTDLNQSKNIQNEIIPFV